MWSFTRSGGAFVALPGARLQRFVDGTESLADRVEPDGFVYLAEVLVLMRDRDPQEVVRIAYAKMRTAEDGRIDRQHWDDALRSAVGQLPSLGDESAFLGSSRFHARRYQVQHTFSPAPGELAELRAAINQRAKKLLV